MGDTTKPLLLVAPGDAVCRPLLSGLDLPPWRERVEVEFDRDPDDAVARLAGGGVDAALLPVDLLARHAASLEIVPGLGISTSGPAPVARLEHSAPLDEITAMASRADRFAAETLTRLLFAASGVAPPRRVDRSDATVAARLASGDDALRPPELPQQIDLGAAWTELTGLPFVWAVWCARPGAIDRDRYRLLHAARTRGKRLIPEIADEFARSAALGSEGAKRARAQLGAVRYRFGRDQLAALRRFWDESSRAGLLEPAGKPRFVPIAQGSDCWTFAPPEG